MAGTKSTLEDLRELNVRRQKATQAADLEKASNEEMSKPSNDNVNDNSNEQMNDASLETVNDGLNETSSAPTFKSSSASLQERLSPQTSKEPIMRLNVELGESLHLQLKQYCVTHKIPIRLLVTALIEDFLKETAG